MTSPRLTGCSRKRRKRFCTIRPPHKRISNRTHAGWPLSLSPLRIPLGLGAWQRTTTGDTASLSNSRKRSRPVLSTSPPKPRIARPRDFDVQPPHAESEGMMIAVHFEYLTTWRGSVFSFRE